jgi:hypothetical protein
MRSMLLALSLLLFAIPSRAADGILEINQTCAVETGCFAGDAAGFPVTITTPGSYLVTGNLEVTALFKNAIELTADRVSLHLGGHSLVGPDGSSAGTGIEIAGAEAVIANGTIRDFFNGIGPESEGVDATNSRVHDLSASSNQGTGIVLGAGSRVAGSTTVENGSGGVRIAEEGIVRDCIVKQNGSSQTSVGISTGVGGLVESNVVAANAGRGILVRDGSVVRGNVVSANQSDGISINAEVSGRAVVSNNASSGNAGYGIATSGGSSLIRANAAVGNRSGLDNVNIQPCANCTLLENHTP